ncbi:DUF6101 family protein [Pelagibacterium xiamenense]|uniref:DUF6101 family protein n=1 Tax=Pelagibacterium xiamenense TaxID=2901140 RepID=UPI001E5D9D9D|nr:DUF6101 family protein [Pelagibacterium xiamenense]MCD7059227.1 DUF6101 family protein [Pelagibacterium xiamenense]
MVRGASIIGSPVALQMGNPFPPGTSLFAANDNRSSREVMTVTVRRVLDKSGLVVKVKVPVGEYTGVAVATSISEEGELSSAIELIHPNPELNYRVYEEKGNTNVVAEWQNWGKKLRLPLYIRAGDGNLIAYSQQVDGLMVGSQSGRRMLGPDVDRRTRFARRRKPGEQRA